MATVRLERETMTGIADAVRECAGTQAEYYASEIPEAIRGISGGSSVYLSESGNALLNKTIQKCIDADGQCNLILSSAFCECSALSVASFPACEVIGAAAFQSCIALESFYLLGSGIPTLSDSDAFTNTPMSDSGYLGYFGSFYVPSSLLTSYQEAANWSYYADRMVGVNPADYGM